jgi:ribosomal-protein-alanine N-acetyltransferase
MTRLRLPTPADSHVLAELQVRNRTYLAPWEPVRPEDFFRDAGQRADLESALDWHERGDAAPFVILDDDGTVVGRLTLSGIVRGPFQSCAMGYVHARGPRGAAVPTPAAGAGLGAGPAAAL